MPQSAAHVSHDSLAPQNWSPHVAQAPQSLSHSLHDSPTSQSPLPHTAGQTPQSLPQFLHDSPNSGLHLPSPQVEHAPQSFWHDLQSSPGSQTWLPHCAGQLPQSSGQTWHDSPSLIWHWPSPHAATWGHCLSKSPQQSPACLHPASQKQPSAAWPHLPAQLPGLHVPQSAGHVLQFSWTELRLMSHLPSPHSGGLHGPQSCAHTLQFSLGSHLPLPQLPGQGPQSMPHTVQFSVTSQTLLPHTGWHLPQSLAHLAQSSPISQVPLPQVAGHWPQSTTQFLHDSPTCALQKPSPHAGPHLPQSTAQDVHDSPLLASHF